MESGKKETESAWGMMEDEKEEESTPAFSLFALSPARFIHFDYSIANFIGKPSKSLCGGERGSTVFVTLRSLNTTCSFNRLFGVTTVLSLKPSNGTFKTLSDFATI